MSDAVLVALLSLAGTLLGSWAGVKQANKLVNYRIDELEKKVEKHNNIVERTAALERDVKAVYKIMDDLRR